MTISGAPNEPSRSANSFSTSARLLASQAKVGAPISLARPSRSPVERAASATLMPSEVNTRASAALSPAPAPTISAVLNFTVGIASLRTVETPLPGRWSGDTISQTPGVNDAGGLLRKKWSGARRAPRRGYRNATARPGRSAHQAQDFRSQSVGREGAR